MIPKIIALLIINFILLTISLAQDTTNYIQLSSGEKVFGKVELKEPFLRKQYLLLNDSIER